jgi:mycothiol system anti-sigma-R factor
MNCEQAIGLVDGYLDGELDAITNREIELHLRDCGRCQEAYEAQHSLVRMIEKGGVYYKAPAGLRERIQSSLREGTFTPESQTASAPDRPLSETGNERSRTLIFGPQWNWLALAALLMIGMIIAFNLTSKRTGSDQFLATQLIASHVRSLLADHLTDVASSDQHTVKPWLDTKLDFAPAVPDLSSEGFPLLGGRLDYLENRPVAALVYQRRKHFINLFVWPAESGRPKTTDSITRQGYQLLHWADSDFNYWAVSDVSNTDLQAFKQAFGKQVPNR